MLVFWGDILEMLKKINNKFQGSSINSINYDCSILSFYIYYFKLARKRSMLNSGDLVKTII